MVLYQSVSNNATHERNIRFFFASSEITSISRLRGKNVNENNIFTLAIEVKAAEKKIMRQHLTERDLDA